VLTRISALSAFAESTRTGSTPTHVFLAWGTHSTRSRERRDPAPPNRATPPHVAPHARAPKTPPPRDSSSRGGNVRFTSGKWLPSAHLKANFPGRRPAPLP